MDAYINCGAMYFLKGEVDLALADFNAVLEQDAHNITARLNRGQVFLTQKKYKQAVDDFTVVLKLEPHNDFVRGKIRKIQDLLANNK